MKPVLVEIHCPSCSWHTHIPCETLVIEELEPRYKQQILEDKMFHYICPCCKASIQYLLTFTYMSKKGSYLLILKPDTSSFDIHLPFKDVYTYKRFVHTVEQLKEKIRIFDDGLHDYAIELLKYQIKEKRKIEHIVYYDRDKTTHTLWFQIIQETSLNLIGVEEAYYAACEKQIPDLKDDFLSIDLSFILNR